MPVGDLLRGRRPLNPEEMDRLEEALLSADLGVASVMRTMEALRASQSERSPREVLQETIERLVSRSRTPAEVTTPPRVVFAVGVNGVGKTTTLGKLASLAREDGQSVMLCAADTFRAAAAEQLEIWARRTGAVFHRGSQGADPAAVLTDGLRAARARHLDLVLVDTAGRLHTKGNLMAELAKMARVSAREVPGSPHETLLVLDATVGGNGLVQGREFARSVPVTGIVLTKLDGTAKGGIVVAVVDELNVPIQYVGVGEQAEDLLPFNPAAFAASLVGEA
jgi:fused signal recognition particle receptor